MDDTLTIDTVAYTRVYKATGVPIRRNTALGLSSPRELSISHQASVNSKTKEPSTRSVVRFDFTVPETSSPTGKSVRSAYLVVDTPQSAASADMDEVIDAVVAACGLAGFRASLYNQEN